MSLRMKGFAWVFCVLLSQSVQLSRVEAELLVQDVSPSKLCLMASKLISRPAVAIGYCSVSAYFISDLQKQQPEFFPEEVMGQCRDVLAECLQKFSAAEPRCDFEEQTDALSQCRAPVRLVRQCVSSHAKLMARLGRVLKCGATIDAEKKQKLEHKLERMKQKLSSCETLERMCPEFKDAD